MAYGPWEGNSWHQIWSNGKYAVDLWYAYRQDSIANKTEYKLHGQRCRSLTQYHSYSSYNQQYGYQFLNYGKIVDGKQYYAVNAGGAGASVGHAISVEKNHNFDGKWQPITISAHWIANLSGQNYVPEWDWINVTMPSPPNIDRNAPNFTATLTGQGLFSLSFELWSNSKCSLIEYSIDGGAWKNTGVTVETNGKHSFELTELNPGQAYMIKFKARRDHNHVYSSEQVLYVSTLKPSRPTKGRLTVSNIQPFSVHVSWSGFSAGEGASINKYEYSVDGSVWHNLGNVQEATISGLEEETSYVLQIRAVDNFEQASDPAIFSFQTIADQLKILINVNGAQKVGRVFVNVGGVPKKVKKCQVNVDGVAKRIVSVRQ